MHYLNVRHFKHLRAIENRTKTLTFDDRYESVLNSIIENDSCTVVFLDKE